MAPGRRQHITVENLPDDVEIEYRTVHELYNTEASDPADRDDGYVLSSDSEAAIPNEQTDLSKVDWEAAAKDGSLIMLFEKGWCHDIKWLRDFVAAHRKKTPEELKKAPMKVTEASEAAHEQETPEGQKDPEAQEKPEQSTASNRDLTRRERRRSTLDGGSPKPVHKVPQKLQSGRIPRNKRAAASLAKTRKEMAANLKEATKVTAEVLHDEELERSETESVDADSPTQRIVPTGSSRPSAKEGMTGPLGPSSTKTSGRVFKSAVNPSSKVGPTNGTTEPSAPSSTIPSARLPGNPATTPLKSSRGQPVIDEEPKPKESSYLVSEKSCNELLRQHWQPKLQNKLKRAAARAGKSTGPGEPVGSVPNAAGPVSLEAQDKPTKLFGGSFGFQGTSNPAPTDSNVLLPLKDGTLINPFKDLPPLFGTSGDKSPAVDASGNPLPLGGTSINAEKFSASKLSAEPLSLFGQGPRSTAPFKFGDISKTVPLDSQGGKENDHPALGGSDPAVKRGSQFGMPSFYVPSDEVRSLFGGSTPASLFGMPSSNVPFAKEGSLFGGPTPTSLFGSSATATRTTNAGGFGFSRSSATQPRLRLERLRPSKPSFDSERKSETVPTAEHSSQTNKATPDGLFGGGPKSSGSSSAKNESKKEETLFDYIMENEELSKSSKAYLADQLKGIARSETLFKGLNSAPLYNILEIRSGPSSSAGPSTKPEEDPSNPEDTPEKGPITEVFEILMADSSLSPQLRVAFAEKMIRICQEQQRLEKMAAEGTFLRDPYSARLGPGGHYLERALADPIAAKSKKKLLVDQMKIVLVNPSVHPGKKAHLRLAFEDVFGKYDFSAPELSKETSTSTAMNANLKPLASNPAMDSRGRTRRPPIHSAGPEPLYTEISIPAPPLPSPASVQSAMPGQFPSSGSADTSSYQCPCCGYTVIEGRPQTPFINLRGLAKKITKDMEKMGEK